MNVDHHTANIPLPRPEVSIVSPLRYPGSKRRLGSYINRVLAVNQLQPELFIEPFAGGASVALQLLSDGAVERIGLADRDPLVAAFWRTVFFDTDWLVEQIEQADVSIDTWHRIRAENPTDIRGKAFKCLFLNRTNFSGIMAPNVGPIGGRLQTSSYKIDCRFPRGTLVRRIKQAQLLADRVAFVWSLPWKRTLSLVDEMQRRQALPRAALYYFDPPFFEQAEDLYSHWFKPKEHIAFRNKVVHLDAQWIISYDSVPRVRELYSDGLTNGTRVQSFYTAGLGSPKNREEAIITNLRTLPDETRLWRTREEWEQQS